MTPGDRFRSGRRGSVRHARTHPGRFGRVRQAVAERPLSAHSRRLVKRTLRIAAVDVTVMSEKRKQTQGLLQEGQRSPSNGGTFR